GPDPGAPAGADPLGDAGIAWMIDFSEALARGMAMKLRLPDPPPARIARLVVVGVETSLTPDQSARELGDALAAHRYTRGIGFRAEGTPTNLPRAAVAEPADPAPALPPDVSPPPVADGNADAAAWTLGLAPRAAELFGATAQADDGAPL